MRSGIARAGGRAWRRSVGVSAVALGMTAGAVFIAGAAQAQEGVIIRTVGSDTIRPMLEAWAAAFRAKHGNVQFRISSPGSGEAAKAPVDGNAEIGPMSREMTGAERETFARKHGGPPLRIRVALDALAVFVHNDNPMRGLTMAQLAAIFAARNTCGGAAGWGTPKSITRWDQVIYSRLRGRPIEVHGRNTKSGTYAWFRKRALCGAAFRATMKMHPDSKAVVEAVSKSKTAIGFAGIGFDTDKVRPLAIALHQDDNYAPYIPEKYQDSKDPALKYKNVISGKYPLSRPLFLYVVKPKGKALPAMLGAFLAFVLSEEGQAIVERRGEIPIPAAWRGDERKKLSAGYTPE